MFNLGLIGELVSTDELRFHVQVGGKKHLLDDNKTQGPKKPQIGFGSRFLPISLTGLEFAGRMELTLGHLSQRYQLIYVILLYVLYINYYNLLQIQQY